MQHLKYAWDSLFLFMIVISLSLFLVEVFTHHLHEHIIHTVETIDFILLSGYYFFFANDLYHAKNKLRYCKQHWLLIILLALPFVPLARLARFALAERVFVLTGNMIWHVFDELQLL